jgi:hypothetical protein
VLSGNVQIRISFPAADDPGVTGYGFGLNFGFLGFDRIGDQLVPFRFDFFFSVLFHTTFICADYLMFFALFPGEGRRCKDVKSMTGACSPLPLLACLQAYYINVTD